MGMEPSVRMPHSMCPYCGAVHDAAAGVSGKGKPVPGDLMVCICCAGIGMFGPDLQLTHLPDGVLDKMREQQYDRYKTLISAKLAVVAANLVRGPRKSEKGGNA